MNTDCSQCLKLCSGDLSGLPINMDEWSPCQVAIHTLLQDKEGWRIRAQALEALEALEAKEEK